MKIRAALLAGALVLSAGAPAIAAVGIGSEKDDWMVGTSGEDWLYGYGGNDDLSGRNGPDHIYGGEGDDVLKGGEGPDEIRGQGGYDICYTDNNDELFSCEEVHTS